MSEHSEMNRRIAANVRDGSRAKVAGRLWGTQAAQGGLIDGLQGADMGEGRRQRLSEAEIAFETAVKNGDEVARDAAKAEIRTILEEGHTATREATEAEAEKPSTSSFDGGVRRTPYRPGYLQMRDEMNESPAALFRRALQASAERDVRRITVT